jgi:hypothetical protein
MDTSQNWRGRPGRDPETEANRLKQRFGAVSRHYERAMAWSASRRAARRWGKMLALVAAGALAAWMALATLSPWPPAMTLRHLAAAPNCDAARFVKLAPSHRGGPGYWQDHDADGDGVACEPWRVMRM